MRAASGLEQGAASLRLRLCRQEAGPPPPPPLFLSSLREAAAARTCGKSPRAGGLPRNSIYAVDSRPFPSSADVTRSIPARFHCVRSIPRPIPSSSQLAAPASATGIWALARRLSTPNRRLISYGGRHMHACRGDPDAQYPGHALSPTSRRRLKNNVMISIQTPDVTPPKF